MATDHQNVDAWDALHEEPRFRPVYPHDRVVSWTLRTFARDKTPAARLLDLGCGAGRHTIFWGSEGYQVTAADASKVGIHETQRRADEAGLTIETTLCGADALPYDDASFDGVLCYGVLCYLPLDGVERAVREIHRVLRPGGSAMVVTRSDRDSRFVGAEAIGELTYRVPELGVGAPSNAEAGMLMSALTRDAIARLFSDFDELVVNRSSVESEGGAFVDDDFHIIARR